MNHLKIEDADSIEINQLYTELLRVSKINNNNWWATISNAEFLMLLGKINPAISKVEEFIKNNPNKLTPSNLNPTLRQLEIYRLSPTFRDPIKPKKQGFTKKK